MAIDTDAAYRAVRSRDSRFDGMFYTGVRTTGIYCRPSCSARTPHRKNVDFYPSSAAAQRAGLRACKMCRPDATPGSADWNTRADLAGRAIRLIADGVVDRDGVTGLARQLGYSERQVTRALVAEMGAPPVALARAQRAQTARILLETTTLPAADIAFAAGFSSVRQFNDTIREIFDSTPTGLRRPAEGRPCAEPGSITLRLAYRPPMDLTGTLDYLSRRAVPGLEDCAGTSLPPDAAVAARRRAGHPDTGHRTRPSPTPAGRPPGPGRRGGSAAPTAGPGRRSGRGGRGAGRPAGRCRAGSAPARPALAGCGGRLRDGRPGPGRPAGVGGRGATVLGRIVAEHGRPAFESEPDWLLFPAGRASPRSTRPGCRCPGPAPAA